MISHNIHANYVNIEKTYKKTLKQLDGENEQKKTNGFRQIAHENENNGMRLAEYWKVVDVLCTVYSVCCTACLVHFTH